MSNSVDNRDSDDNSVEHRDSVENSVENADSESLMYIFPKISIFQLNFHLSLFSTELSSESLFLSESPAELSPATLRFRLKSTLHPQRNRGPETEKHKRGSPKLTCLSGFPGPGALTTVGSMKILFLANLNYQLNH